MMLFGGCRSWHFLGGVPGVEFVGAVVVWEGVVRDWLVLVVGCVG